MIRGGEEIALSQKIIVLYFITTTTVVWSEAGVEETRAIKLKLFNYKIRFYFYFYFSPLCCKSVHLISKELYGLLF